jgi:uncharacterized cupredoxin-like copper-binding protein
VSSSRRVSRAPVLVTIGGLALAFGLVFLGARLAATPAPVPTIDRPGTADQPREVNVLMHDYAFNPRTLRLVAGETVRLHVINAGLIDHEFALGDDAFQRAWAEANAAATPPAAFATAPPASVPPVVEGIRVLLRPGELDTVLYSVPMSGQLALVCHLPGHAERGMVGVVSVERR